MENDNRNLMRATPEWMAQKYQEINDWLFGGKLGACNFEIFTSGKGSGGNVLGWFCIDGGGNTLKIQRNSRRIYIPGYYTPTPTYINNDNFVKLCHPTIKLNGNYSGTEESLLCTLVHEMCHYYTYMYGWAPVQAHGREFRDIAAVVASRSKGLFNIQRLASAEEMQGYELDDKYKEMKQKRLENKKSRTTLVVVYMKNGEVRLINASSQNVIDTIKNIHEKRHDANYILISNDPKLLDIVFNAGFKSAMRTYRYWTINDKPELLKVLNNKDNFEIDEIPFL